MFLSCWMDICQCLLSVLLVRPTYRIIMSPSLSMHGDYFHKSCHHKLEPEPACTVTSTAAVWGGASESITRSLQTHVQVLLSTYIWQVYPRYIYVISIQLDSSSSLAVAPLPALPDLISAAGRFRLGLSADPFCLGHQKSIDSRLKPAKVPHLGVELMNMTAPVCSLACTVGIPEFKGLILS